MNDRPLASELVGGRPLPASLRAIQRPDGTSQVTYAGRPLYFFRHSHGLDGGTSAAGITAFGGTFQVVSTAGTVG